MHDHATGEGEDLARLGRWILANSAGELVALGLTTLAGVAASRALGVPDPSEAWAHRALFVVAGAIEGGAIGTMQALALRHALGKKARARWALATIGAFAIAWTIAALLSDLEPSTESVGLVLGVAASSGAALGVLVGGLQSVVVRREVGVGVSGATWVVANALAWSAGLVVTALGADLVPDGAFTAATLAVAMAAGAATGAIVGAITGWVIFRAR